jgi:CRP-like cAMP-binding protein
MATAEARAALKRTALFGDVLSPEQIDALAANSHLAIFPEGAVLMTEGDFGSSLFVIVKGDVTVTLADRKGHDHEVATVGAGGIVGEMSLMTGARRNATVVAAGEVVALEIPKVALETILARAPDLINRFGAMLASRQSERDKVAARANSAADFIGQIRHFFGRRD